MLRPDAATLRAVEAHARALCCSEFCISDRLGGWCAATERYGAKSVRALAAYHAALGETARAAWVERCANTETGEE